MTGPKPRDMLPGAEPFVASNIFEAMLIWGAEVDYAPDAKTWYDPTQAPPGSPEKIEVLRQRAERGLPLWHQDDRRDFTGWHIPVIPRIDED